MTNPIYAVLFLEPFSFALLVRYLVNLIYDPPVQEVQLVWVVGRSMEPVNSLSPGLGVKISCTGEKLLYRSL